jgi:tetratricopeptide (TPR) repeat protein
MATVVFKLKDFIVDPEKSIDLASLPPQEAIDFIKLSYGFLSSTIDVSIDNGFAVISLKEPSSQKAAEAQKIYDRGVREAEQGDYAKAIKRFQQVIEILPHHIDARRNLAMAYLESKNIAKAKEHLMECSQLDPNNVWTLILLGNLYVKHERNLPVAEFYYEKGFSVNPNDIILLNNYAALKMELKDFSGAQALFEKALAVEPSYPNTYLGLSILYQSMDDASAAVQILGKLFDQPKSADIRSASIYQYARDLYLDLNKQQAEKEYDQMMECISAQKKQIGEQTGFPVQIVEDNNLEYISGTAQIAWKHNRRDHVIKYRNRTLATTPHLLAHEMEHIVLEQNARQANRNKFFMTTPITREYSIRTVDAHILKLKKQGYHEDQLSSIIPKIISGLCLQLFNCPLDMFVEYNLYDKFPVMQSSQFVSLHQLNLEAMKVFTSQDIKQFTPPFMYRASITLNCATALFVDDLFKGKTDYAAPYKTSEVFQTGRRLFDIWKKRCADFHPGDEYDVVDEYARLLKLQKWYTWGDDPSFDASISNPEKPREPVKADLPEAYSYCLDALKRFDGKSRNEIFKIASEVGLLGTKGIDHTTPGKTYTLKSYPKETFTGMHLLCIMYVGFKLIEPDLDTGLDFKDAYEMALEVINSSVH